MNSCFFMCLNGIARCMAPSGLEALSFRAVELASGRNAWCLPVWERDAEAIPRKLAKGTREVTEQVVDAPVVQVLPEPGAGFAAVAFR